MLHYIFFLILSPGIGWHIETDCNDRTDVQAVQLQSDTSDSDNESLGSDDSEAEINIRVLPDYGVYDDEATGSGLRASQEVTITLSRRRTLPGQISDGEEESSEGDSGDEASDFEDIPECAELVHEEVRFYIGLKGYIMSDH